MLRFLIMAAVCAGLVEQTPVAADPEVRIDGARLFESHCSGCHPDGRNIVNPAKPLDSVTLKAMGIDSVEGIVGTMRKPGHGMTRFDQKLIPDREAEAIAEYVLKTFK